MKIDTKSTFSAASAQEIPSDPVLSFVHANRDALWQAVRLLGGYESSRIVDRCAELLERDGRLTHRTRLMLDQIHSVLSLERTDDPELPFMGCFAAIDPGDPVVTEICLLCDGLSTVMAESARREREDDCTASARQAA